MAPAKPDPLSVHHSSAIRSGPSAHRTRCARRRHAHRVQRADGPERIAEEWWTEAGAMARDAIRDYYRVEDDEGRRFWLFRAGLPGDPPPRWFVHGIFA